MSAREEYRKQRPFNKKLEKKTINYALTNSSKAGDYAKFFPALGTNMVSYGMKEKIKKYGVDKNGLKYGSRLIDRFDENGEELCFFMKDNGSFFYPYGLFSAGHANLDNVKAEKSEKYIRARDDDTIVIGDSGGFQIATGVLSMDWKNETSVDKMRMKILRWLEETADYSMILDVPTYTIEKSPQAGMKNMKDCLDKTRENIDYFIKHRRDGMTKFLNIIQGRSVKESCEWYDMIKDYPLEGWSLAGNNTVDLEMSLTHIIRMRDDKKLNQDQHWLHFLGVSRLHASCIFTTIQRILRKTVSDNITISYDASSPFLAPAKHLIYTGNILDQELRSPKFTFRMDPVIDSPEMVHDDRLVGDFLRSIYPDFTNKTWISENTRVNEICVRSDKDASTTWDTMSYIYVMSHNLEMQIQAIQDACRYADMDYKEASKYVPHSILMFNEIIGPEILESETPFDKIKKYRNELRTLMNVNNRTGNKFIDSVVENIGIDETLMKTSYDSPTFIDKPKKTKRKSRPKFPNDKFISW